MKFIYNNWKILIFILTFVGIYLIYYYWLVIGVYLNSKCETTYQNYKVEIIAGIIFSIAPIILGFYFGKEIKEQQFYKNAQGVLETIRKLRQNDLIKPLPARQVVKSVARNFGDEALKEKFAEKAFIKFQKNQKASDKCKICDLEAEIVGRKCKYCKMNCFAWDLSNENLEDKEISEIKNSTTANSQ